MSRITLTISLLTVLSLPVHAMPRCELAAETRLNAAAERVTGVAGAKAGDQIAVSWTTHDGVHFARVDERLELLTPDQVLFPASAEAPPAHPSIAATGSGFEVGWSAASGDLRRPWAQRLSGTGASAGTAAPLDGTGERGGEPARSIHAALAAAGGDTLTLEIGRFEDGMRVVLQQRSGDGAPRGAALELAKAGTAMWPRLVRVPGARGTERWVAGWIEGDGRGGDVRLAIVAGGRASKILSLTQGGTGGAFALLADRGRLVVAYDSWQGRHFDQYLARVDLDTALIERTPIAVTPADEFDPLVARLGDGYVVVSGEYASGPRQAGELRMVIRGVGSDGTVRELARKVLPGGLSYQAGALAMEGSGGVLIWSDDRELFAEQTANVLAARLECSQPVSK